MNEMIEAAYLCGFEPSREEMSDRELFLEATDFLYRMGK
jgi:hypothetical protein